MTPMGGWETCTAIIGVAAVIASAWTSIYKHKRPTKAPIEASLEGRVIKLEGEVLHAVAAQKRLEKEQADKRERMEKLVDGIYVAINELRKEILDLVKKGRA